MTAQAAAREPAPFGRGVPAGAFAGAAGGLVWGAAMVSLGTLPDVAVLVGSGAPWLGFVLSMLIAVAVGAVFGLFAVHQRVRSSELLFWGLAYGVFWWFLGTLTLLPLLSGEQMTWGLDAAQEALPSLFGHLYYGAVTAVVFAFLQRDGTSVVADHLRPKALLRGLLAAGIVAGLLVLALDDDARLGRLPVVALCMGAGYPLLFTGRAEGTGPAVVRGTAYGFLWWVVAALTAGRLLDDGRLDWSRPVVAEATTTLPPYLLAGAGIAAVFGWLGSAGRALFVDDVRLRTRAAGSRGLRVLGYGSLSGLIGGVLFGVVWGVVDVMPTVAKLVGANGTVAGWVVHLLIAQGIGVSYSLLFRGRGYDLVSGVGWGLSYGFFWWVFGGLTLMPAVLGVPLWWTPPTIAADFASLIGHLAYGGALGAVHAWMEHRENPWWLARSDREAARATARRDQVLGSAPALWTLTALIALTIPVMVVAP